MVVSAPAAVQRERVLARGGMSADKLDALLKRQMSDADKRARADFVVDTSGEIPATQRQIDAIVVSLRGRVGTAYAQHWA